MLLVTSWSRRSHIRQVPHHSLSSLWDSSSHCDNFHTNPSLFLGNMSNTQSCFYLFCYDLVHASNRHASQTRVASPMWFVHISWGDCIRPGMESELPVFTLKLNCMFLWKRSPVWNCLSVFSKWERAGGVPAPCVTYLLNFLESGEEVEPGLTLANSSTHIFVAFIYH